MTLTGTAKKLGVSIYHYLQTRFRRLSSCQTWPIPSPSAPLNCRWAHLGNQHNRFPRIIEKIRPDLYP